ncbi:MFS transporter [Streptomyces sp. NPDC048385]|uniref:MFS transporter n=1 Tax=Streptomyces sp. NPDC048385 TaxID=3155145 RepID=UPI00342BF46B
MLATSVVGRFSQGMTGLALMMLTTERSTYAVASVVSTAAAVGGFVAGPVLSRLADRYGRRRVLVITAVLYASTMGVLAAVPPQPLVLTALSLVAGLCTPPMTAAVRAALPVFVGQERRRSAFALESTAQELIFVLGPPATALCASLGGPPLAVATCGLLVLVGTLGYTRGPYVEVRAPHAPETSTGGGHVLRTPGMGRVLVTAGLVFASLSGQTLGVVAMVDSQHVSPRAGLVLACGSLGSLVGGLAYGALRGRPIRFRHLSLALSAGLVALAFAPDTRALVVLVFLWGLTVAPTISCLLEWLSSLAPPESATEAFGWLSSALIVGNSLGSLLGGVLITTYDARAPIAMAAGFALLAALVSEEWQARTPIVAARGLALLAGRVRQLLPRFRRRAAVASDGTMPSRTDQSPTPPADAASSRTNPCSERQDHP